MNTSRVRRAGLAAARLVPVAALATVLAMVARRAAAAGDRPVRIMPLGDSITQGNGSQNSWRRPLWHKLKAAGYDVDFVGSLRTNFTAPAPDPDFDLDHEGHWGWKVSDVLVKLDGWLAQSTPDVILVHLGTNDAHAHPADEILADLGRVVDLARKHNPRVSVVMAQLMTHWGAIGEANPRIPDLAGRMSRPGSPVIVVDQRPGFDARKGRDTVDGCHPNDSGEEKMAARWFEALEKILPKPGANTEKPKAKESPEAEGPPGPSANDGTAKPKAPVEPKEKSPPADVVATWDGRLRKALAARLARGSLTVRLDSMGAKVKVASVKDGQLVTRKLGAEIAFPWERLSAADRRNIALAVADRKQPKACALAAFYVLLAGDGETGAAAWLRAAGKQAAAVREAFE